MRYSYYVEGNRLCETLAEATAFVAQSQDEALNKDLLQSSQKAWRSMKKIFEKDEKISHYPEVLDSLKQCEIFCQKVLQDFSLLPSYIDHVQEFFDRFCQQVSITYRIVFLSDLGGKWDSMRSVYEEYCRRPDCEVTVVLMPIFRQIQKNGKVEQEVVYEDYFTSMGIPYVEYTKYDLKKDCPDLVFTSNPYDSTVLPQFYAEEIAKVSRLVYVPYFSAHILDQNAPMALCQLPIYECAWKVITQSEKTKHLHNKYGKKHGRNVLVTGLPKWDEAIYLKRNGLLERERNLEWEAKFAGHKTILWTTWYDLSRSSVKYWDQILNYLENNPEFVLIWRPHPMTIPVTKLYFPEKYAQLQKIIEEAKSHSNMVLDQNASYRASFTYSDGMITDISSMTIQYLLQDKPVLWIYSDGMGLTNESVIDPKWMQKAMSTEKIWRFFDQIKQGKDDCQFLRKQVIEADMPLADGNSGKRVVESLFLSMYEEDGVSINN